MGGIRSGVVRVRRADIRQVHRHDGAGRAQVCDGARDPQRELHGGAAQEGLQGERYTASIRRSLLGIRLNDRCGLAASVMEPMGNHRSRFVCPLRTPNTRRTALSGQSPTSFQLSTEAILSVPQALYRGGQARGPTPARTHARTHAGAVPRRARACGARVHPGHPRPQERVGHLRNRCVVRARVSVHVRRARTCARLPCASVSVQTLRSG